MLCHRLMRRKVFKVVSFSVGLLLGFSWMFTYMNPGMTSSIGTNNFPFVQESLVRMTHTHSGAPVVLLTAPSLILGGTPSSVCKEDTMLLIYVQSKWTNFLNRRYLRRSWASVDLFKDITIKTVFVVGKPEDVNDQIKLNNENLLFGDIIEGNVTDSYGHLTIKNIIAMKWINDNCKSAKFILKTDDDIFINIFKVVEKILPQMNHREKTLGCHVIKEGKSLIVRDKNNRWFIPDHIFPNQTYFPQFCTGYAVIMTSSLIHDLYTASITSEVFNVDDVYMFGHLTAHVPDLKYIDLSANFTLSQGRGLADYKDGNGDFIVVNTQLSENIQTLWGYALLKMSPWARQHSKVQHKER